MSPELIRIEESNNKKSVGRRKVGRRLLVQWRRERRSACQTSAYELTRKTLLGPTTDSDNHRTEIFQLGLGQAWPAADDYTYDSPMIQ